MELEKFNRMMFSEEEKEVIKRKDDERDWAGLPFELLQKIYSFLLCRNSNFHGSTRFRFHLTCKSWQTIRMNQHPVLFSIPTQLILFAQRFQQVPLLISTTTWNKNEAGTCKLLHPVYKETYVMDYPEIAGASIVHSKYGWLLIHRVRSLFFFDPFTRTVIDIVPKLDGFFNITFTAPPTSPDCMLFYYNNSAQMCTFRLGQDENWKHYYTSYQGKLEYAADMYRPIYSPVFCNGCFYWFDINGKLGYFNPKGQDNKYYVKLVGTYISARMNYIAECNGELYTIVMDKNGSQVRVFKLDCCGDVLNSVELKSLGNKTIYISDIGTVMVQAKVKGTENKIYFPRLVGEEGIFYCLRSCRYQFFGCSSPAQNWNETKEINPWIESKV